MPVENEEGVLRPSCNTHLIGRVVPLPAATLLSLHFSQTVDEPDDHNHRSDPLNVGHQHNQARWIHKHWRTASVILAICLYVCQVLKSHV